MVRIFDTEEALAKEIAQEMHGFLNEENPVFCLASGSTPEKSYKVFSEIVSNGFSISNLKIVSLDEWVGISKESEGSCFQMLAKDLFNPVGLQDEQICFFDGTAKALKQECSKIDQFIDQNPISFSLMGVGMNGHIGLNEPGCEMIGHSSVVNLSKKTKEIAQKYFDSPTVLEKGLTIGLQQVIGSKRVIVAITGAHKAEIVKEIFSNSERALPVHELMGFEHIDFYLDKAAAQLLDKSKF